MSEIVDLGAKRLTHILRAARPLLREEDPQPLLIIGCSGCGGETFHLGTTPEGEQAVVCSGCKTLIASLSWFDKNLPPRPAA